MTQLEKLYARIKQLCNENPSRAFRFTVIVDGNKEPLLWFCDEPVKSEGKQDDKDTQRIGV